MIYWGNFRLKSQTMTHISESNALKHLFAKKITLCGKKLTLPLLQTNGMQFAFTNVMYISFTQENSHFCHTIIRSLKCLFCLLWSYCSILALSLMFLHKEILVGLAGLQVKHSKAAETLRNNWTKWPDVTCSHLSEYYIALNLNCRCWISLCICCCWHPGGHTSARCDTILHGNFLSFCFRFSDECS